VPRKPACPGESRLTQNKQQHRAKRPVPPAPLPPYAEEVDTNAQPESDAGAKYRVRSNGQKSAHEAAVGHGVEPA
jgi:hypothetical protein